MQHPHTATGLAREIVRRVIRVFSTRNVLFLSMALLAVLTTGCLSRKSYVDTQYRRATLAEIKPPENPKPVVLEVSFQCNGKDKPAVNGLLGRQVMKVLRETKVFADRNANPQIKPARLKVIVNNFGDLGDARAKGFATGLTFGMAGSEVVDYYEMTAIFTPAGGNPITKTYKHALHSTIGAHTAPPGLEPVPNELAFAQIMEDMCLNFLNDLQKEGLL